MKGDGMDEDVARMGWNRNKDVLIRKPESVCGG
jgi:hypothetical protein